MDSDADADGCTFQIYLDSSLVAHYHCERVCAVRVGCWIVMSVQLGSCFDIPLLDLKSVSLILLFRVMSYSYYICA